MPTERRNPLRSKWFLPLFAVFLGAAFFAAQAIGGDPGGGAISFAILAGVGLAVLRGDGRDERFAKMDIHATALAGTAIITAIIVVFLVEIAQGKDGIPYAWLGAVGGLTYIAAIVVFRLRS